jgi:hypothetical protein
MSIVNEIEGILSDYQGISLKEVQKASLMRRKDRKYLFNFCHLPTILSLVEKDYRVLDIDNRRSHNYLTRYYDTSDLQMYSMHHRGKANRHKIRFRKYGTSDLHFLEIKRKNSKGVTQKNRIKTNGMDDSILSSEEEFLLTHSPYKPDGVELILENRFNRITLVSRDQTERITLDYGLQFFGIQTDKRLELPGISIAEIKYEKHLASSPFNNSLRKLHIPPQRFSKYAIGTALLNPDLKQNRFKVRIRKVHQINNSFLQTTKHQQNA